MKIGFYLLFLKELRFFWVGNKFKDNDKDVNEKGEFLS